MAAEQNKPAAPTDLPNEEWRPVLGYEGLYSVSNLGRVRSERRVVDKADGTTQLVHSRILAAVADSKGYLRANLFRGNVGATCYLHRMVLDAFVGPLQPNLETRHLNGNPEDNRLDNLRYGTRSENFLDAVRHNTHRNSRKSHCPQGHPYDLVNTYMWSGRRHCRACRNP